MENLLLLFHHCQGKLEQFEEAIPVSLLEPHPDFIVTPNQYITQYEIEDTVRQLKKYFPNFKFTSVDNGLEQTVQWFISQYPNLRLK